MRSTPDGVEVVATAAEARTLSSPPLLITEAITAYLDSIGLGSGPLSWDRIGEGQSNVTYLMARGGRSFVLRRGPRPPYPPSAHNMTREAKTQTLLAAVGVPVPKVIAVCSNDDVLGVPFYVMEYVEGVVITDTVPPALDSPVERRATGLAAVDALIQLHAIDVSDGAFAAIGRPEGYLDRQLRRYTAVWEQVSRRSLPAVAQVADWLAAHRPITQRNVVVHGDFRIGNLMFSHGSPARVEAILDWELSTVGDPLADLGYLTATYSVPGSAATPINLTPVTAMTGYPTREELIERYATGTGLDPSGISWYQALGMWKAAIFCEAIYSRWLSGERPGDTFAPTLEAGIPRMLEDAEAFIAAWRR